MAQRKERRKLKGRDRQEDVKMRKGQKEMSEEGRKQRKKEELKKVGAKGRKDGGRVKGKDGKEGWKNNSVEKKKPGKK